MIEILEPLCALPGVDLSMLVTPDGVQIASCRSARSNSTSEYEAMGAVGNEDALAALAVGWANELKLSTAPLSWEEPTRIVLRCARGSLVMRSMRGAILMLVLERTATPEDVRLSMDGTVARIERSLRGTDDAEVPSRNQSSSDPPGPIPSKKRVRPGDGLAETSSNTSRRKGLSGN